jgi:cytoskeletal protein RodZ
MSRKTRRSRRGSVLVLVTLLLAAGVLVLWTRSGDTAPAAAGATPAPPSGSAPASEPAPSAPTASEPTASESTASDPAAPDADATAGEESAEATTKTVTQPNATTAPEDEEAAGPAPVAVSLTYAGYDPSLPAVVAGGYAAGVVEVDATCTLVLRREGVELRGEALGSPNAGTTDCGEVRVGGDALTSGTWEAVLSYTSETSVGESAPVDVEVP